MKDVYVSQIDEERAEAIVVADVDQDGAGGPRTLYDIYILLTFVEVDGDWKVDQVTDLNFADGGADPGGIRRRRAPRPSTPGTLSGPLRYGYVLPGADRGPTIPPHPPPEPRSEDRHG